MLGWAARTQAGEQEAAPPVVPLDNDTCSITRHARDVFTRDTQRLKAPAMEDADKYCASQNKQLKLVSVKEEKPSYIRGGFAKTTVTFKVLDASDPELASGPARLRSAASRHPVMNSKMTWASSKSCTREACAWSRVQGGEKRLLDRLK